MDAVGTAGRLLDERELVEQAELGGAGGQGERAVLVTQSAESGARCWRAL
ncbi:hypothetical protein Ae505Ps2_6021c [Pseudonocardia sp. Ae505_Ps2]|nr:hypothetical protein Ae505Ps2_6021c [Pseudonocardia sp. Ae505_Ps2]